MKVDKNNFNYSHNGMEDGIARLEVNLKEDIVVGMPVGCIYTTMWECIQRCIDDRRDSEKEEESGFECDAEDENACRGRPSYDSMGKTERAVVVKACGWEKKVRVNYNIFKSFSEFSRRLADFLKELAALSEELVVEIEDVDKSLFLGFLLDSFNLFGDVESVIDGFRPAKRTPIQRSGLTSEEMLRTLFLLQNLDGGMRLFLSFNVFAISIYHGDKYVVCLLDGMYRRIVSDIIFNRRSLHEHLFEGDSEPIGAGTDTERYMMTRSLLNGLYLLFDIFNVSDPSLRSILHVILMFLSGERSTGLVDFLGLNDLFICVVRSICGDLVPSHLLMMACRDKLSMKYKAGSMGLSMDYVYNWIYKPHLAMMMPEWFCCPRGEERDALVQGRPIEAVSDRITMELTKDDKESSSVRGPAYSPLSRRLSGGLRNKSQSRFRSKQKLDFGS
ncbi:hypothetical protein J0A71_03g05460 [Encephalitozoon cuniculi]|nr:hypothetical protein J0A71_03g05460 [Encephalitozoon cuniculi]